ncbi:FHA domain-containing protein [Streptomyces sp. NPDC006372]|uniref:FHA domain-containing protein n=1 Tax=Streptomyces sp. NPDC006372 TaxID=3155599 RepID=UPI0033B44B3E
MQIRLTVVDPLGPSVPGRDAAPRSDVLVTAPAGTALAAVASALAQVVSGGDGSGTPVLYAGEQRLDAQRCTLGEPPLTDGAVLSVGAPGEPEPHPELADAPAQLQVVAGPDAGGVHLLHGGEIRIGRSADADVPLDDPDVSRLHCAVTVSADGRVSVADLDSTNGTTLDGTRVGGRQVRFAPGALLRIGESALRLAPPGGPGGRVETTPDGEGHVRVPGPVGGPGPDARVPDPAAPAGPSGPTRQTYGSVAWGTQGPAGRGAGDPAVVPGQGGAPRVESTGGPAAAEASWPGAGEGGRRGPDVTPGQGGPGSVDAAAGSPRPGAPEGPRPGPREGTPALSPESWVRPPRQRGAAGESPYADSPDGVTSAPRHPGAARSGLGAGDTHSGRSGIGAFDDGDADGSGRRAGAADSLAPGAESGRKGTPLRGTDVPPGTRRRGGLGAWARRLAGGRGEQGPDPARETYEGEPAGVTTERPAVASAAPETWPDPAALLLTALGPGSRLWERGPGHPEALAVRLGTADRAAPDGSGLLPAVPVTAGLLEVGALGLAGPRGRLAGLARAVLAQLAALHSPDTLEIVLIAADRSRSLEERTAEWSWLGWLPHVRPGHGQDCRLLLAHDREQAAARTDELLRRLDDQLADAGAGHSAAGGGGRPTGAPVSGARGDAPATGTTATGVPPAGAPGPHAHGSDGPLADAQSGSAFRPQHSGSGTRATSAPPLHGSNTTVPLPPGSEPLQAHSGAAARRPSWAKDVPGTDAADGFPGPYTVVVVDGDPGGADLREAVARLALEGPRAGIHVVCLAEAAAASPASPVTETYEAACSASPTFRQCGAVALLSGDVATALRLMRVARAGGGSAPAGPVGHGTIATVDAVSPAWAERFARALAPLRTDGATSERQPRVSAPLPQAARLLDELGLARATPASLMARWADAADDAEALGGRVRAVLGAGPRGPVSADLAHQGPHLLIEGPPGSGRTELLRAVVASLAAAERPDRLGVVLVDGRGGPGAGGGPGDGLRVCTDVPHVTTYLTAHDPVRMREFAQSLSAELKRRAELLGRSDFAEWHTGRELSGRMVTQRTATARGGAQAGTAPGTGAASGAGDLDSASSSTVRLRPGAARRQTDAAPPLPRLVVVVDDLDALVSPALGSTGRPAAGSVMRALEAVAREGERLGVHMVAATGPCARTAETEPARRATLRVTLEAPVPGPDEPAPGRGRLEQADGRSTPFQGGRVTGRIPRTATLRPTVVPLEWHRMGDPPARRPVRELGNGPTDLALLASALERAAREVAAAKVPSLL